jgi:hypothetical protein
MAKNLLIECNECGTKESFEDSKAITYARWKIIAWNVKTGDPKCVCNKCEYKKPKKNFIS